MFRSFDVNKVKPYLGAADGADLLRGADGARAHADPETVSAGENEVVRLQHGNDVTSDHVDLGELLLEPAEHVDLVNTVTLGGIDDDDVDAGVDERNDAVAVGRAGRDGGADEEALVLVLARVGERLKQQRQPQPKRDIPV